MSIREDEKIIRRYVGEVPLLQSVSYRLGIRQTLEGSIKPHGNEKVSVVDSLMLLLFNITSGRQPLYEMEEWVLRMDPRMFGYDSFKEGAFNDDRFGRALDKLYLADRATLMTEIVTNMIKAVELDLSRVHNDSTSVKAYGKISGTTRTGLSLEHGVSKDHRPDLKQLVYCLSISADGAVPIHYKTYPGNRTDDTTHIETWDTIRKITGHSSFLYVADCKVCTDKQLTYIVRQEGRVLTVMPETWKEAGIFKDELRLKKKQKKAIWRRKIPGHESQYETFSCFVGENLTLKKGYALHWILSGEKKKQDRLMREKLLQKAEYKLMDLVGKLNARNLKTKEQILKRVNAILDHYGMKRFYHVELSEINEQHTVQIGKGRPGPNTKYNTIIQIIYSLSWSRNKKALCQEKNIDGIFPLLCTDKSLTAKEVLIAYKYQPRLEKRFTQFKSIHKAAPLHFKRIQRVEAIMFLFFLSLILQAVIEREVRLKMKENNIDTLPVYPEHRLAYHPTTAKIFDRFEGISVYQLKKGTETIKEFTDSLTDIHEKILELLQIPEYCYWPCKKIRETLN